MIGQVEMLHREIEILRATVLLLKAENERLLAVLAEIEAEVKRRSSHAV